MASHPPWKVEHGFPVLQDYTQNKPYHRCHVSQNCNRVLASNIITNAISTGTKHGAHDRKHKLIPVARCQEPMVQELTLNRRRLTKIEGSAPHPIRLRLQLGFHHSGILIVTVSPFINDYSHSLSAMDLKTHSHTHVKENDNLQHYRESSCDKQTSQQTRAALRPHTLKFKLCTHTLAHLQLLPCTTHVLLCNRLESKASKGALKSLPAPKRLETCVTSN